MQSEVILNVFPGASEQNRLVLVQATTLCGLTNLMLRQETHSPDVGWFTQSCVAIEPNQVAGLKMTLSPKRHADTSDAARVKRQYAVNSPSHLKLHEAV